ncbi:MAG: hypothetical protein KF749_04050 [Bacteroidetes bacterium]|nr:hypothetical protein [Bacteroidota bacterium]MCW5897169.1 hypothetical protein [Bacteroidota bacterium]
MKQKTSFYFVLYLVALVSLLDVISERDEAQREIAEILVRKISTAPDLQVPDTLIWFAKDSSRSLIRVRGLVSEAERASILYELKSLNGGFPAGLSPMIVKDSDGNGIIMGTMPEKGTYTLQASAEVSRELPNDLPESVLDLIKRQIGNEIPLKSNPATFTLRVEPELAAPPKLTLTVEPPKDERWIVGSPYAKSIYVGGPDPRIVSFSVSDPRFTIVRDIGRIRLEWSNPIVTNNPISVTVSARANRGAAPDLENATTSFTLSVAPPRWDPEPPIEAYWEVPFTFASGVRGLDASKFTVEILANGTTPIRRVSAIEYPIVFKPERTWTSLTFRVLSVVNTEMLKKEIPVKKPIPPQIKWIGSTWQGNEYVIKFSSVDVGNGDVVVDNCTVIQPEGIVSRLDSRRGKQFTLTVQNLQATRPSAIKLKVTVTGIGGSRTDQVTQAILY